MNANNNTELYALIILKMLMKITKQNMKKIKIIIFIIVEII